MKNIIHVFSSEGALLAEAITGRVMLVQPVASGALFSGKNLIPADPAAYTDSCINRIVRFDVEEFRNHYGYTVENMPKTIDILDLGFWHNQNRKNIYTAPEQDFRAEILQALR